MNTGMRRGELTCLTWSDLNLPGKRLYIRDFKFPYHECILNSRHCSPCARAQILSCRSAGAEVREC